MGAIIGAIIKMECFNEKIGPKELGWVLGSFLGRSPYIIQVHRVDHEPFHEGFGLDSEIHKLHIDYAAQHDLPLPGTILLKKYRDTLIGISNQNQPSKTAYRREKQFYEFANVRLFVPGNGTRLFPTCYNAGLESHVNAEDVTRTLKELERNRILLFELIGGGNLDSIIYEKRSEIRNLKRNINRGDLNQKQIPKLEAQIASLQCDIRQLVMEGLSTTRYLHDKLNEVDPNSGIFLKNHVGKYRFLTKFLEYNRILRHPTGITRKRAELVGVYEPILNVITGQDDKTHDLVGIIHADLHQGNIVTGERNIIRFTDAGNIITDGATVAFDLAPQVFNPPVVIIPPEQVSGLLESTYLKNDKKTNKKNLTLATILAGHNWCLKAAAANRIAISKSGAQYRLFLSRHPNHEDIIPQYVALSDQLLEFLIQEKRSFSLNGQILESIQRLRELGYAFYGDLISAGKSALEAVN